MKKIIVLAFVILLVLTNCSPAKKENKIKVAVTIFPLYDAAKNIAGDKIEVALVLPSGTSPHTFTLSPSDLKRIEGAKYVFYNGFGLDDWAAKISENLNAKLLNVSISLEEVCKSHNNNPHFWLNPDYFLKQCEEISESFISMDPLNKQYYVENFQRYSESVKENALKMKEEAIRIRNKNIITFHDAFPYFAEYFGLNIVGVFEESPGKLATPKQVEEIEKVIKENNIKVVFKEPQEPAEIYKTIVADTNVEVLTLNPLGDGENIKSYNDLIKYNIEAILYGEGID